MQDREIVFDIVACQLGPLLLAASERGVCHVRFGEEESQLERDLRSEFAFAALRRDPVPPGDPKRRRPGGLSLGIRTKASPAGCRSGGPTGPNAGGPRSG